MLEGSMQKVQKKVASWKGNLLSQVGRLILIRHVLLSYMATHNLVMLPILNMVIKKINLILSTFLSSEDNDGAKKKWYPWSKVCKPIKEGGDGIRDMGGVGKKN